jgi:ABC-2 type transport system ATP-binding protein
VTEGTRGSDGAAIVVRNARKVYRVGRGQKVAVDDVSIRVDRGRVHGLLGPNGAGKTTTLKMILGLVRPTAGEFELLGQPASPAARSALGFLPESPYFSKQLTALQTLRLYGMLSGVEASAIADRSQGLLERVGLGGSERLTLDKYSRGMLQRLGIAQALIGTPELVILDEPASGLDPVGQRDVRNLIMDLKQGGTTVLLSSHQLSEVEAVCDTVSIFNRGEVAAEGLIDDLLNVAGETSFRVRLDADRLPETLDDVVSDVAVSGGVWVFSVPDGDVRRAVDDLDDAGAAILAVTPKRESLEDYFSRLLEASESSGAIA